MLSGVSVIEWPEILGNVNHSPNCLHIHMKYKEGRDEEREITLTPCTSANSWSTRIADITIDSNKH